MNAFHRWYEELSSLSRDIVLHHFCANPLVPLGQLAQKHAVDRETIRQRRNYLAHSFDRLLEDGSILGNEIARAELDLQKPFVISSFLHRHPWLGERVEDGGLTVLSLFTGMRWPDGTKDPTGQWIYGADLLECADATVRALDLDADEVVSLSAARRLLDVHEVPVPEDPDSLRAWLVHCGFESDGDQVSLSAPESEEPELAGPAPEVPDDLPRLIQRLTELLQVNENLTKNITLGDLIRAANELDGELGEVSRRFRDAMFVGSGAWIIPDEGAVYDGRRVADAEDHPNLKRVTESIKWTDGGGGDTTQPIAGGDGSDLSAEPHASSDQRRRADLCTPAEEPIHSEAGAFTSPADRIAKLLEGTPEGLSSSRIKRALGSAVSQEQVVKALFEDDRFAITHQGAWCLHSNVDTASSSSGTPEHPLFVIAGDAPDATPSTGGATDGKQDADEGDSHDTSQREYDRLDKIESALREADQSLSIEELKARTGITLGHHYLKQQIEADPRFSRSQRSQWALAEWGMPVYKPIKELISDMVDIHGGSIAADEIVRVLCRDFDIKESSLRQAMSSPPFTARGGTVRRLGENSAVPEAAIPAAPASEPEQSVPEDEAPDVDDLMGRMGLN
ncbi:hypothetical protein [Streptomyces coeruleorubidus]